MRKALITIAAVAASLANVADEEAPRRPLPPGWLWQERIAPVTDECTGAANGTPCDDGNACTEGDTCQSGLCQGGTPTPLGDVARISVGGSEKDTISWTPVPRPTTSTGHELAVVVPFPS